MTQESTETILVVDDNANNLQLLFDALQKKYRIIVAQDGPSALTRLAHISPDLILLDIMMPEMSGFDVYERIQSDYPSLDVPVIFLSALSDTNSVVKGFRLNAVDYITKPFRLEEVMVRVEKHLTLRRMRKEVEEKNAQLEQEIAERKRAEARLRVMEAAVTQSNDGILITKAEPLDPPGPEIVYANDSLLRQTGYLLEEILGQTPRLFQGDDTDRNQLDDIRWALRNRRPIRIELINYRQDGIPFWVELAIAPVNGERDTPTHFVSIQRDITHRKEAEQALQRAYDTVALKARRLSLLNEITQMTTTIVDWRRALEIAAGLINLLFKSQTAAVLLHNQETSHLQIVSYDDPVHDGGLLGQHFIVHDDPLAERVLFDTMPLVIRRADDLKSPLAAAFFQPESVERLLAVNLLVRAESIGLILIAAQGDHHFDEEEISLAETVAGQIAGAIETARLFEAEQTQRRIAESLRQVAVVLSSNLDRKTVLTKILEQLERVVAYSGAAISLPQGGVLVLSEAIAASQVYMGRQIPLSSNHPAVQVFHTRQTRLISDTQDDLDWEQWQESLIRSWMGAPLLLGEEVIGVLTVDSFKANAYTEKDTLILQTFANQAAIALRNAEQVQRIEDAMYEAGLLYRIGNILAKTPNAQQAIEKALAELALALEVSQGRLILFDLENGLSEVKAVYPFQEAAASVPYLTSSVCHQIIHTGQTINIVDLRDDPLMADYREMLLAQNIRTMLLTPLVVRGQVIGVLEADVFDETRHFTESEINLARAIADQMATAVESTRLFEEEHRQRELAEARNKELDAFSRTVAHDIKNPLGAIVTYSDFIVRYFDNMEKENLQDYLNTVHQAGRKGINIVDELLLLAGVRKQTVSPHPVEMDWVVEQAKDRLSYMIEEYGGEIVLPQTLSFAMGHAPWVEEVWVNYLSNGLKYGGQPPRLEVGAERQADGMVRYWVKDNGQGLTAEAQAKLFTEFTRLDEVRAQGHGLGLSIVRRIIEKLGGQVGIESEVGQGSLFYFTLPAVGEY